MAKIKQKSTLDTQIINSHQKQILLNIHILLNKLLKTIIFMYMAVNTNIQRIYIHYCMYSPVYYLHVNHQYIIRRERDRETERKIHILSVNDKIILEIILFPLQCKLL